MASSRPTRRSWPTSACSCTRRAENADRSSPGPGCAQPGGRPAWRRPDEGSSRLTSMPSEHPMSAGRVTPLSLGELQSSGSRGAVWRLTRRCPSPLRRATALGRLRSDSASAEPAWAGWRGMMGRAAQAKRGWCAVPDGSPGTRRTSRRQRQGPPDRRQDLLLEEQALGRLGCHSPMKTPRRPR